MRFRGLSRGLALRAARAGLSLSLLVGPVAPLVSGSAVAAQTAPAAQALLAEDGFPDNRNGWPIGTHRYIEGERYHLVSEHRDSSRGTIVPLPKVSEARDVVVEAELRFESGPASGWHGLAARVGDEGAYRLLINRHGAFVLDRLRDDDSEDLVTPRPHMAVKLAGQPNVLRLALKGETLSAWINGQQVAHVQDEVSVGAGGVGLTIAGGQHVSVRRVLVTAATDADVTPPPAREPLFEDLFFDNRNGWQVAGDRPNDIDNYFDEAGYHLAPKATSDPSVWWFRNVLGTRAFPADVVVEADLTLVAGDHDLMYGVMARTETADDTGYSLVLSGDRHFALIKELPGDREWLLDWTPSAVIRPPGQSNVVRLVARGGGIGIFINGKYAARVEDATFSREGAATLRVSEGLDVAVRRFSVHRAEESDLPPLVEPPLLLLDELRGAGEDWPVVEGEVYFQPDGYHVNALHQAAGAFGVTPVSTPYFSDLSLRADITALEIDPAQVADGVAFGIGVRVRRQPRVGYRFLIDHDGWFALVRLTEEGEEPLMPWQRHAALRVGSEPNTLRLTARGNTLSANANGQQLAVVEDPTASSGWGDVQIVASAGTHVVARRISATGAGDHHFEPPAEPPAPKPAPPHVSGAPCLPSVEAPRIEPWGVRVAAMNGCGRPMTFALGYMLSEGGRPAAITGTARWEAGAGERRELFLPADTRGATEAAGLATGVPAGSDDLICMEVGANRCLAVDPLLRVAVDALTRIPPGAELLRTAAERGVSLQRGVTQAGSSGVSNHDTRTVTMDVRLDAFGDWDRAAILAHELQHVADGISAGTSRSREECLGGEGAAFRKTAEVWDVLWQGRLPSPQNGLQRSINETAELTREDPTRFAAFLADSYEHQCA